MGTPFHRRRCDRDRQRGASVPPVLTSGRLLSALLGEQGLRHSVPWLALRRCTVHEQVHGVAHDAEEHAAYGLDGGGDHGVDDERHGADDEDDREQRVQRHTVGAGLPRAAQDDQTDHGQSVEDVDGDAVNLRTGWATGQGRGFGARARGQSTKALVGAFSLRRVATQSRARELRLSVNSWGSSSGVPLPEPYPTRSCTPGVLRVLARLHNVYNACPSSPVHCTLCVAKSPASQLRAAACNGVRATRGPLPSPGLLADKRRCGCRSVPPRHRRPMTAGGADDGGRRRLGNVLQFLLGGCVFGAGLQEDMQTLTGVARGCDATIDDRRKPTAMPSHLCRHTTAWARVTPALTP